MHLKNFFFNLLLTCGNGSSSSKQTTDKLTLIRLFRLFCVNPQVNAEAHRQ